MRKREGKWNPDFPVFHKQLLSSLLLGLHHPSLIASASLQVQQLTVYTAHRDALVLGAELKPEQSSFKDTALPKPAYMPGNHPARSLPVCLSPSFPPPGTEMTREHPLTRPHTVTAMRAQMHVQPHTQTPCTRSPAHLPTHACTHHPV